VFPEIVGTRQRRVHDSPPILRRTFLDLKLQLFPVGIDHHVNIVVSLRGAMQAERQATGILGQIGGGTGSEPGNVLPPEPAAAQRRMRFPERNHGHSEWPNAPVARSPDARRIAGFALTTGSVRGSSQ